MYPIQERVMLYQNATGATATKIVFPQEPTQGGLEVLKNGYKTNRGHRGARLTIVMNNANGGTMIAPVIQEVFFDGTNYAKGKSWAKSANISAAGIYTLTVYPGLLAASGNDDMVNDTLGYALQVILDFSGNNKMTFDAYIDFLP